MRNLKCIFLFAALALLAVNVSAGGAKESAPAQGSVQAAAPEADPDFTLYFVCTGNTCRSPLAENLFRDYLSQAGVKTVIKVDSYGVKVDPTDNIINLKTNIVLSQLDVDHNSYRRSKQLDAENAKGADLIICMTDGNAELARSIYPQGNIKTYAEYIGAGVPDPWGEPLENYYTAAIAIRSGFDKILEDIQSGKR
jgi:protein-tyrosine-phosphatase